jgi:hypothetical protein
MKQPTTEIASESTVFPAMEDQCIEGTAIFRYIRATDIELILALLSLFFLSFFLRIFFLGNTFQSSDNAEIAWKILRNNGYSWILRDYYGAIINVYIKFSVGLLSSFGVTITEFWWRAPVAVIGALQAPLTYFFLKRSIGCTNVGALAAAAFLAILPIHVFISRFLYGYEVLGVFFVTLAIWKLLDFFAQPTLRSGLLTSIFAGLYLISHGFIIPFIPCLISLIFLFGSNEQYGIISRFSTGVKLCLKYFVWLFPLLFFPLCVYPLGHALRKPTQLGLYLQDYAPGFIENAGYFLVLLLFTTIAFSLCAKSVRSKYAIFFVICGVSYLAPLFLGTPQGITVVRMYMLMGTYFLILSAAVFLDNLAKLFPRLVIAAVSLCFFVTLWGTVESLFGRDEFFDPSGVRIKFQFGIPPDPGSKAAGFLIRKYVKDSEKVLAIHGNVEPPILFYYFGRSQYSFFDLSASQAIEEFDKLKDKVDVVICSEDQSAALDIDNRFIRRSVIFSEARPRMIIYTKPHVEIPVKASDVRELNLLFDRTYSWQVSLR